MPSTTPNFGLYKPNVNDPTDEDIWGDYLNTNMDIIDTGLASAIPVGAGLDFWGTTAPTNYMFAYGQAISRTTYSALFALIGTTFGAGDGSTTFNLPDKRGRASFGKDNMGGSSANRLTAAATGGINGSTLGATGGEQAHTLTSAEIPAHTHPVTDPGHKHKDGDTPVNSNLRYGVVGGLGSGNVNQQSGTGTTGGYSSTETTGITVGANVGGGSAHNVVPPGIVCNYIIRVL